MITMLSFQGANMQGKEKIVHFTRASPRRVLAILVFCPGFIKAIGACELTP